MITYPSSNPFSIIPYELFPELFHTLDRQTLFALALTDRFLLPIAYWLLLQGTENKEDDALLTTLWRLQPQLQTIREKSRPAELFGAMHPFLHSYINGMISGYNRGGNRLVAQWLLLVDATLDEKKWLGIWHRMLDQLPLVAAYDPLLANAVLLDLGIQLQDPHIIGACAAWHNKAMNVKRPFASSVQGRFVEGMFPVSVSDYCDALLYDFEKTDIATDETIDTLDLVVDMGLFSTGQLRAILPAMLLWDSEGIQDSLSLTEALFKRLPLPAKSSVEPTALESALVQLQTLSEDKEKDTLLRCIELLPVHRLPKPAVFKLLEMLLDLAKQYLKAPNFQVTLDTVISEINRALPFLKEDATNWLEGHIFPLFDSTASLTRLFVVNVLSGAFLVRPGLSIDKIKTCLAYLMPLLNMDLEEGDVKRMAETTGFALGNALAVLPEMEILALAEGRLFPWLPRYDLHQFPEAIAALRFALPQLSESKLVETMRQIYPLVRKKGVALYALECIKIAIPRLDKPEIVEALSYIHPWITNTITSQLENAYRHEGIAKLAIEVVRSARTRLTQPEIRMYVWMLLPVLDDAKGIVKKAALETIGEAMPFLPEDNMTHVAQRLYSILEPRHLDITDNRVVVLRALTKVLTLLPEQEAATAKLKMISAIKKSLSNSNASKVACALDMIQCCYQLLPRLTLIELLESLTKLLGLNFDEAWEGEINYKVADRIVEIYAFLLKANAIDLPRVHILNRNLMCYLFDDLLIIPHLPEPTRAWMLEETNAALTTKEEFESETEDESESERNESELELHPVVRFAPLLRTTTLFLFVPANQLNEQRPERKGEEGTNARVDGQDTVEQLKHHYAAGGDFPPSH